jgi:hypothetical protein
MKDLQICFSIEGHFDRARVWPAAWGVDSPFVDLAKAAAENVSAASVKAPASLNPISQNEADILNPDGRSVLLPKREFMDAAELLSWIAFRRSLPLGDWGNELYKISRNWPFRIESFYDAAGVDQGPFGIPGGPATLRDALSAEVDGAGWRDGALLASAVDQSATEHAIQSLLSEFSASDLLAELTENLSRAEKVNPKADLPPIGDPRVMRDLAHVPAWPSGPAGAERRRGQTARATPLPAPAAGSPAHCAA